MSQSDYIKYKKVSNLMKIDTNNKQPPVITEDNYIMFKQYNLVNSIVDTKVKYNVLTPSGTQDVFGILRNPQNCPTMLFCRNTNLRSNRIPMLEIHSIPKFMPLTIKDTKQGCNEPCKKIHFGIVR